jgi:hypothetical protein
MEVHEHWDCTVNTIIYGILFCQSADANMAAMGILEVMCDKYMGNLHISTRLL